MIGDIHVSPEGVEYEVVWAGGEGLVAPRDTKRSIIWTPPPFPRPNKPHDPDLPMSAEQVRHTKRAYNKTDPEFWKRYVPEGTRSDEVPVDKEVEEGFIITPVDLD